MNIFIRIERNGRKLLKKVLARLLTPYQAQYKLKKPKNVVVVRIDERLGNLVLLNAVVKSFIKNNIQPSLIVCKKYGEIYQYNKDIKEIIYFNKQSLFNPVNLIKLILRLRKQKYDLLFDASNPNDLSTLTFFVIILLKAEIKLGYERKESNIILNRIIHKPDVKRHILDYYAGLFKSMNLKFTREISFNLPKNIIQKYNYLRERNKKIVIVHPGGRGNKKWKIESLLVFLEKIKKKKFKFIILLGPEEYDIEKTFLLKGYSITKPKNVIDLVSILHTGKIYIGNDSGPMHLAAALNLAVFAVFKPVASIVFCPVARHYEMVVSDYPRDLSVQEVYKKYQQFLKRLKI